MGRQGTQAGNPSGGMPDLMGGYEPQHMSQAWSFAPLALGLAAGIADGDPLGGLAMGGMSGLKTGMGIASQNSNSKERWSMEKGRRTGQFGVGKYANIPDDVNSMMAQGDGDSFMAGLGKSNDYGNAREFEQFKNTIGAGSGGGNNGTGAGNPYAGSGSPSSDFMQAMLAPYTNLTLAARRNPSFGQIDRVMGQGEYAQNIKDPVTGKMIPNANANGMPSQPASLKEALTSNMPIEALQTMAPMSPRMNQDARGKQLINQLYSENPELLKRGLGASVSGQEGQARQANYTADGMQIQLTGMAEKIAQELKMNSISIEEATMKLKELGMRTEIIPQYLQSQLDNMNITNESGRIQNQQGMNTSTNQRQQIQSNSVDLGEKNHQAQAMGQFRNAVKAIITKHPNDQAFQNKEIEKVRGAIFGADMDSGTLLQTQTQIQQVQAESTKAQKPKAKFLGGKAGEAIKRGYGGHGPIWNPR